MSKKISELTAATAAAAADLLAIVQSGVTKKITKENLRGYKIYSALITQEGTAAPTVIILENTIGIIVWTRIDIGFYQGELVNAFVTNKTAANPIGLASHLTTCIFQHQNTDTVSIETMIAGDEFSDNLLVKTFIEIRVYN